MMWSKLSAQDQLINLLRDGDIKKLQGIDHFGEFFNDEIIQGYYKAGITFYTDEGTYWAFIVIAPDSTIARWKVMHPTVINNKRVNLNIDSGFHSISYDNFKKIFTGYYGIEPKDNEVLLFTDFGLCEKRYMDEENEEYKALKKMVAAKDEINLGIWLRSPCITKQLYAVAGYNMLGRKVDRETLKVIKHVLSKMTKVTWVCDGVHDFISIQDAALRGNFNVFLEN